MDSSDGQPDYRRGVDPETPPTAPLLSPTHLPLVSPNASQLPPPLASAPYPGVFNGQQPSGMYPQLVGASGSSPWVITTPDRKPHPNFVVASADQVLSQGGGDVLDRSDRLSVVQPPPRGVIEVLHVPVHDRPRPALTATAPSSGVAAKNADSSDGKDVLFEGSKVRKGRLLLFLGAMMAFLAFMLFLSLWWTGKLFPMCHYSDAFCREMSKKNRPDVLRSVCLDRIRLFYPNGTVWPRGVEHTTWIGPRDSLWASSVDRPMIVPGVPPAAVAQKWTYVLIDVEVGERHQCTIEATVIVRPLNDSTWVQTLPLYSFDEMIGPATVEEVQATPLTCAVAVKGCGRGCDFVVWEKYDAAVALSSLTAVPFDRVMADTIGKPAELQVRHAAERASYVKWARDYSETGGTLIVAAVRAAFDDRATPRGLRVERVALDASDGFRCRTIGRWSE